MNSNFYIPTDPRFQHAIHSIWQIEYFPSFHTENIIPKGVVEIIFNFSHGAPILASIGNKQDHLPGCFINGFNTMPVQLQLPKQHAFFGVRFQPLAIKKILRTAASEFSDITVDLTLIDPAFHSLWQQLAEQDNFNDRVTVFLSWLKSDCFDFHPQEQLLNDFLSGAGQHHLTVTALANSLCYSTRHLSRKLVEATGMNTEEMMLYKKYLHAVDLIHHTDLSLTAIAYQSNFSDQSHFIKTFRSYTEITPGEYKKSKSYIKGHIYGNVR